MNMSNKTYILLLESATVKTRNFTAIRCKRHEIRRQISAFFCDLQRIRELESLSLVNEENKREGKDLLRLLRFDIFEILNKKSSLKKLKISLFYFHCFFAVLLRIHSESQRFRSKKTKEVGRISM